MSRLFGTDGVRGLANGLVTAELALKLGVAAAHVLAGDVVGSGRRPAAVVGRDPRASGEFLEGAIVAGLASAGVDVLRLGVLPTPAVAYLTGLLDADFGVMLSASHNPMPDNGIKFFARGGHKLEDALEDELEAGLDRAWERPVGGDVGRVRDLPDGGARYVEHLCAAAPTSLAGLRVVLDCAEGAASEVAPAAFRALGADVVTIHDEPDGLNINRDCGSTNLTSLRAAVVEHAAGVGFAFDGDADRVLAVDAAGRDVDGDQILAILALALRRAGRLPGDRVVATVMSNLGFVLAMKEAGIAVVQADVGDRYVLEAMRAGDVRLGGEQSGHIVMTDHATTGDGILTALTVAGEVVSTGTPMEALAGVVTRLPQVLVNVSGVDKARSSTDPVLLSAVADAQQELDGTGRVLLRPSGTEPLVRVMVEAATREHAQEVADRLAGVVRQRLSVQPRIEPTEFVDENKRRLSRDESVALLHRPVVGVLSSLAKDGWIHSVPVHYLFDDEAVLILCGTSDVKARNVARTGKATFCVEVTEGSVRTYVTLVGAASIEAPPDSRVLASLDERYGRSDFSSDWDDAAWATAAMIRLVPERWIAWTDWD